ncbi:hypothetical protein BGW39_004382, partial [Mortierella sp. 14UC]
AEYTVHCAIYNDATNTLESAWSWRFSTDAVPVNFAIGHEHLYVLSRKGPLNSYPLFPISKDTIPASKTIGTPPSCSAPRPWIVINQKAMYLICIQYGLYKDSTLLYVSNDPVGSADGSLGAAENITAEGRNTQAIRAIGSGTGDGHFLLLASYSDTVALSLDGAPRTSYNLTKTTVSDTSGYNVYDGDFPENPWGSTVGAICGVVILGVLAVFLYKWRRNKAKAAQDIAQ